MKNDLKICMSQLNFKVGAIDNNTSKIIEAIKNCRKKKVDIVCFPELCISGYPPEDLLINKFFIKKINSSLKRIADETRNICCVIGHPYRVKENLYNCASVFINQKLCGRYYKNHLPNYGVFDEKRYFQTGNEFFSFEYKKTKIAISICEDIWVNDKKFKKYLKDNPSKLLINISASPYSVKKEKLRFKKVSNFAKKNQIDVLYCNLIGGQDELIFDGSSMAISEHGKLIDKALSFKEENKIINYPMRSKKIRKIPSNNIDSIFNALVLGVRDYALKNNFTKVIIGISGGIDSAVVSAISKVALGGKNIYGFALPTEYNSDESLQLAKNLSDNLAFKLGELSIQKIFNENISLLYSNLFKDLKWDIAEENLQSRIRSNLLMAISNKFNYLLLSTGNKSEMSVGYSTIYGDLSGGLAPLKDIPKTLVYRIAKFYNKKYPKNKIPAGIINREPSAELKPNQKDSDSLPPYKDLDKILNLYVESFLSINEIFTATKIDKRIIKKIVDLIDKNEFKRRQGPPGIKVTNVAFGKDRRFPITNGFKNY